LGIRGYLQQLRAKRPSHWIWAIFLIGLGTYLGDRIGDSPRWVDLRYELYQYETRSIRPKSYAQRTVLVLIGDDEFWSGEFERRVPVKRDRLARLLRLLDADDPAVIAVDFDLRSPVPNGDLRENPEYKLETNSLLETLRDISHHRPVVIPKTLGLANGVYFPDADIADGFDFQGGNLVRGYIDLPFDKREIPLTLPVQRLGQVDSFAQAIVKADNKRAPGGVGVPSFSLPFGTFMTPDSFTIVQAKDVINAKEASAQEIAHKVVIVGADWSRLAWGRGGKVDSYLTPAGTIGGVFLHANYVEALIAEHFYKPMKPWLTLTVDIVLAAWIAISFALDISVWWKMGLAILVSSGLVLLSYFFLQNLGSFFDFFVPSILVILHAGFERVREWRKAYMNQQVKA
jgi:CHASE2 domain-containing sensor protein